MRFDVEKTDLRAVHMAIGADLDIAELSLEFEELAKSCNQLIRIPLPELLKCLSSSQEYANVVIVLAQLLAAKPHSADVERCISANNLLKTSLRAALDIARESRFVHHNLPPTSQWNLGQAVLRWLHEKRRRVSLQAKGEKQSYFGIVFREFTDANNDDDSGNNETDVDKSENDVNIDKPSVSKNSKSDVDKKPRSF